MSSDKGASLAREEVHLFETLMRSHQDQLYRVAYRMTGNPDDAEDLVQEALMEAFQSFRRFQPGTHFDRWVYRIGSPHLMGHLTFLARMPDGGTVRGAR